MRTTLTLDPDVAVELERLRKIRDASLKEVVNEALRRGMQDMARPANRKSLFRTQALDLGKPKIANFDNIIEVLAFAEGEDFK
jgi:hypothetical protein